MSSFGVGGMLEGGGFFVTIINIITPIIIKSMIIQMMMPQGRDDDFPANIKLS